MTNEFEILDVRVIAPAQKHPAVFERFDSLAPEEAFVLLNDHDPKPLYYQLQSERGNDFTWQYIEQGPSDWKVLITRLASNKKELTIGQLVAADYRNADVFKKFSIDFCCGGKKSISMACIEKNVDEQELRTELNLVRQKGDTASANNFMSWNIGFLTDYIINIHHQYVNDAIPLLQEYTQKVASSHGKQYPETIEIAKVFASVAEEMLLHMQKEEKVLFPYIKQLAEAEKNKTTILKPPFGSANMPIQIMEMEHEQVGEEMSLIGRLTNNYTPPTGACATFKVAYAKLKEFEDDLHVHVHLENNILFPRAMDAENKVNMTVKS